MVVLIHSPTQRSLLILVLLCVPPAAAVPCWLCSARFLVRPRRKNKYHYSYKIYTGFLCGDGARAIHLFCSCDSAVRFWNQKLQANVHHCYVRRRLECTSLGPEIEHLRLRLDSSLAAKGRADAFHVVFFCNKASEPSTGAAAALCVLAHDG